MKAMLFLLTLLLAQAGPAQQSISSGVIEGTVVRAGTSTPIGKARITLSPVQGGTAAQGATADGEGRFSFRNLAPGQYRLSATRDGYVSSEYGQRGPNGSGIPVSVMSQQTVKDLRIGMTMTGTIAGRVTNRDGEPVGNVNVQAMRYTFQDGRRTLTTVQTKVTNDLGEYRLFWMNPGQYIVSAQPVEPLSLGNTDTFFIQGPRAGGPAGLAAAAGAQLGAGGVTRITITGGGVGPGGGPGGGAIGGAVPPPPPPPPPPNVVDSNETYLPVYYPGTTDVGAASTIDLRAGGVVDSINMVVADVRPVHIRGQVTSGGRGASGAQVSFYQRTNPTGNLTVRSTTASDTGAFDFRGVAPGAYELVATVNGSGPGVFILGTPLANSAGLTVANVGGRGGANPGSPNSTMMAARIPVDVSTSDVDGVTLAMEPGFSLTGKVSVDGRSSSSDVPLTSIRVQLQSDPQIPPLAVIPANPDSTGAFSLSGIAVGTYRLAVAGLPRNTYLKSANLGGMDILANGLRLDSQPGGPLDIVLGTTPGSLDAVVLDEKQMPEASVAVVLIPNAPQQKRFDIYRNGTTDSMGRIHWDGLVPGEYKVYAWEDVESYAWTDPNFMANFDGRGIAVRVTDSSRETVNVKAIPYKAN